MTRSMERRSYLLHRRLQEALQMFVGEEVMAYTKYRVQAAIDYVLQDFEEFVVFDQTDYRARPRVNVDVRVELRKGW